MGEIEVLDLFSAAAGGWSLGMHRAGFTTMAACEVEAWRRALYSENNPGVKVYDDVRTLTADRLLRDLGRLPSVVVGSPPCQDISSANTKGRGVEGERSGLYFEAVRIIGECRPRWFALENSSNLRTRGADAILSALEAIGYACWPLVVRAGDIGANHERPRCWLIGCDLEQVTDPDGFGRHEGRGRRWIGGNTRVSPDPCDAAEDGCRSGLSRGRAGAIAGAEQPPCGDASDAPEIRHAARPGDDEGSRREADGHEPTYGAAPGSDPDHGRIGPGHVCKHGVRWPHACQPCDEAAWEEHKRNTPNPDQARQAHGCMESSIRQAEIADDGRGARRCTNEPGAGQMGLCPPDSGVADRSGPDWSLADLADHLRLDDGLSAWLAGTRVAIGDGKGSSAASLIVEAFGDAVIPQIPEAIGRAILRTESALAAIYRKDAA